MNYLLQYSKNMALFDKKLYTKRFSKGLFFLSDNLYGFHFIDGEFNVVEFKSDGGLREVKEYYFSVEEEELFVKQFGAYHSKEDVAEYIKGFFYKDIYAYKFFNDEYNRTVIFQVRDKKFRIPHALTYMDRIERADNYNYSYKPKEKVFLSTEQRAFIERHLTENEYDFFIDT